VDYKNVYDKIQHEVEDEFFPGSRKKANILTALTTSLIDRMMHSTNNWVRLGKGFFDNMASRDIQIYLHDKDAQESIAEIGADGAMKAPACSNCQMNWFGVVEANLGVNKVNYFINRTGFLMASIENGEVVNRLTMNFTNTSATLPYKNYMRIITMNGSKFDPGIQSEVLVNIGPGESKSMSFTWRNLITNGPLTTVWRKQAGVPAYPISLTLPGGYKYNTTLDSDIWIPTN
jgi:hypothetical protein